VCKTLYFIGHAAFILELAEIPFKLQIFSNETSVK
jgi:hypothetical protein